MKVQITKQEIMRLLETVNWYAEGNGFKKKIIIVEPDVMVVEVEAKGASEVSNSKISKKKI